MGGIYSTAIEKELFKPFSDEWCYCLNEKQKVEYRLDVFAVLAEGGAFTATEEELKEIKAQAVFEVQRKPGAERRCAVEW